MAAVLITGATGLIGRWVREHWPSSLEPVEVHHLEHDLTDPSTFVDVIRDIAPDVVLHLAWCASGAFGYRDSPDNAAWVETTERAASYCSESGIGFIATGTVADTGNGPDAYSLAKTDLRGRLGRQITDGLVTWIRPFYVFDPEAGRPALVADCLAARTAGRRVELRSPQSAHDFIHASDVGSAIALVLLSQPRGIIDIGSGRSHTVRELAIAFGARVSGPEPSTFDTADEVADTGPLNALGWTPEATNAFFRAAHE